MIRSTIASLLVALLISSAVPVRAQGDTRPWLRISTTNFVVYSDAGEERARAIVERLESFRRVLASLDPRSVPPAADPLIVLAFADGEGLKPFVPLYDGKPANKSGIFLPSRERSMVLLDASAYQGSFRVVLHEYAHRVLSLRGGPLPLWLNEGLAEFYSTAEETPEGYLVGATIPAHVALLREKLISVDEILSVTPESPAYNEIKLQNDFYAMSWAVAHYLMLGSGGEGIPRIEAFLERLERGEEQREAFRAAFGELDAVTREVAAHVRRPLATRQTPAATRTLAVDVAVTPAPASELAAYFGLALVLQRRYTEAEPHLARASELDPRASLPFEALGLAALLRDELTTARGMFAAAIERDSGSYRANYYFARVSLDLSESDPDGAVKRALEHAIRLSPRFAESYALLSQIARREGEYRTALRWAEEGIAIAPNDDDVRLALARAQIAMRRFPEGRAALRNLLATTTDFTTREAAKLALASLERYLDAVGFGGGTVSASAERASERLDVPLGVLEELPGFLHLASAGVRGRVERLECTQDSTQALVRVAGRRFVYTAGKNANVTILTLNHPGVEMIECDTPIDRDAIVEFEPEPSNPHTGRLRAIVFLEPSVSRIVLTPEPK